MTPTLTPREYSNLSGLPYSTVISRLAAGLIPGAIQHRVGSATLWEIPRSALSSAKKVKRGRPPNR